MRADREVPRMIALGLDIGGSGIKGALVDTEGGALASERKRVGTPPSMEPGEVIAAVAELVGQFEGEARPVGVGFPAVVQQGVVRTPFAAHQIESWVGVKVAERISELVGRPTTVLNDADAAGTAEMRFGSGRGVDGLVMVLTLGTGIGSALFVDGGLVPNTELGHLFLRNRPRVAEYYAASQARKRDNLSWDQYTTRLNEYLRHLERLFSPRLFIIGGGISKKADKFLPRLSVRAEVVPAALRNDAGIIGAAVAALR
jgi:polyphosphate glucokinase